MTPDGITHRVTPPDRASQDAPVADGQDHRLDPRVITLDRITNFIFTAVLAGVTLLAVGISIVADDELGGTWIAVRLLIWLLLVLLLVWHAYRWPPRAYEHTSYRVDEEGIEIQRGVYFRVVINVPRSRVQHIDVSQGPLERRYGLGTLVVYTAGTEHAKVQLEGLEHGRALRIRDYLLPTGANDAV
jgi:membrane protein YdbS with pleckstrin-like domain